jgi:transposase
MDADLNTPEGLTAGIAEAGTWAELSRRSGVSSSTLKSRALKLGVATPKPPEKTPQERLDDLRKKLIEEQAAFLAHLKAQEAALSPEAQARLKAERKAEALARGEFTAIERGDYD